MSFCVAQATQNCMVRKDVCPRFRNRCYLLQVCYSFGPNGTTNLHNPHSYDVICAQVKLKNKLKPSKARTSEAPGVPRILACTAAPGTRGLAAQVHCARASIFEPGCSAPCAREPSSGRVRTPGQRLPNQTRHIMDRRGGIAARKCGRVTREVHRINKLCEMRRACHTKHGKA